MACECHCGAHSAERRPFPSPVHGEGAPQGRMRVRRSVVQLNFEGFAPHPHPNPSPACGRGARSRSLPSPQSLNRVPASAERRPFPSPVHGRRCPAGADEGAGETLQLNLAQASPRTLTPTPLPHAGEGLDLDPCRVPSPETESGLRRAPAVPFSRTRRRCPTGADEGTGEASAAEPCAGFASHPHPNPSPACGRGARSRALPSPQSLNRVPASAERRPFPSPVHGRRCPAGADEGTGEASGS